MYSIVMCLLTLSSEKQLWVPRAAFKIMLFIQFWLGSVFLAARAFLYYRTWRLLSAVVCRPVIAVASHCGAWALEWMGFSSCSSQALEHRLNSCVPCGMWDLPRSEIKAMSPALAGGFFTTEPPREPLLDSLFFFYFLFQLEANYFTILQWFLPYIDMNQQWVYMCSPS